MENALRDNPISLIANLIGRLLRKRILVVLVFRR